MKLLSSNIVNRLKSFCDYALNCDVLKDRIEGNLVKYTSTTPFHNRLADRDKALLDNAYNGEESCTQTSGDPLNPRVICLYATISRDSNFFPPKLLYGIT